MRSITGELLNQIPRGSENPCGRVKLFLYHKGGQLEELDDAKLNETLAQGALSPTR